MNADLRAALLTATDRHQDLPGFDGARFWLHDIGKVTVSAPAEYTDGEPLNGYAPNSTIAKLAEAALSGSDMPLHSGVDEAGEYWVLEVDGAGEVEFTIEYTDMTYTEAQAHQAAGGVCESARAVRTAKIGTTITAWVTVDREDRDYVMGVLDADDRVASYLG